MATRFSITPKTPQELQLACLPQETQQAFLYCTTTPLFSQEDWYLAGGTALTLQVGHRRSLDLDFFTPQAAFSEDTLERNLFVTGHWHTSLRAQGTLYGTLKGAKISFIAYPFFQPSPHRIVCGHVPILLPPDIAAMKIIDKVEPTKRGIYTGTFGYIKTDGTMDFNILIRTIFIRPIAPSPYRRIIFNVGGGIVADSDPESELEEIKLKAKGIMSALGLS